MDSKDDVWLSNVEDVTAKGAVKEVEVISEGKGVSSKIEANAADNGVKVTEEENNIIMDTNN
jgi:hypothetical protein